MFESTNSLPGSFGRGETWWCATFYQHWFLWKMQCLLSSSHLIPRYHKRHTLGVLFFCFNQMCFSRWRLLATSTARPAIRWQDFCRALNRLGAQTRRWWRGRQGKAREGKRRQAKGPERNKKNLIELYSTVLSWCHLATIEVEQLWQNDLRTPWPSANSKFFPK